MLNTGERGVVHRIEGGSGVRKKLAGLGIIPGKSIGIAHGRGHGPRVVIVDETKVMLGRGLLHKILVSQNENAQ
jgi:ferrous iron transport protein A